MRIKAILLTIVAVLTLGFTSCTDELASDQTQGKPGYLTINVKTLKSKQTKTGGAEANDYQVIKDLNVFVFNAGNSAIIHRYTTSFTTGGLIDIPISTLPANSYVVAVANYSMDLSAITTLSELEALEIKTIRNVADSGLHMTGRSVIIDDGATGGYLSSVRIAPVEAKITVSWTLEDFVLANYNVTGVYVVNAINKTKSAIIRSSTYATSVWTPSDATVTDLINLGSRPASNGYGAIVIDATNKKDFNFYATMVNDEVLLKDEAPTTPFLTGSFHYYVGENYASTVAAPAANAGALITNTANNVNTIVVIRVSPIATSGAIYDMGSRYYTYEFDAASTTNNASAGVFTDGLSMKRKTNYNLAFTLKNLGSSKPFEKSRSLKVTVTADGWEPATALNTEF